MPAPSKPLAARHARPRNPFLRTIAPPLNSSTLTPSPSSVVSSPLPAPPIFGGPHDHRLLHRPTHRRLRNHLHPRRRRHGQSLQSPQRHLRAHRGDEDPP